MLCCVGRISGNTLLYNLLLRKSTAQSLVNSNGELGSSSPTSNAKTTGVFRAWRRKPGPGAGERFELSGVAVNTVTETRHEREREDNIQVVTLPSGVLVRYDDLFFSHEDIAHSLPAPATYSGVQCDGVLTKSHTPELIFSLLQPCFPRKSLRCWHDFRRRATSARLA
jgi:hypothetical protein